MARVRISASCSSRKDIILGLLQDSFLEPPLFPLLDIVNYADDNSPFA